MFFIGVGGKPSRPTLGIKLGLERKENKNIKKITELLYGCFNAARNLRDFEFINKNPDFKNLVSFIDTDDYNWLDFNVSDQTKVDLFVEGARSAKEFLLNFDWEKYKNTREILITSVYDEEVIESTIEMMRPIATQQDELKNETLSQDNRNEIVDVKLHSLKMRISDLNKKISPHFLWINDKEERVEREIELMKNFGIRSTHVKSSKEAKELIKLYDNYDFIISDMNRSEGQNAGADYIKVSH